MVIVTLEFLTQELSDGSHTPRVHVATWTRGIPLKIERLFSSLLFMIAPRPLNITLSLKKIVAFLCGLFPFIV